MAIGEADVAEGMAVDSVTCRGAISWEPSSYEVRLALGLKVEGPTKNGDGGK